MYTIGDQIIFAGQQDFTIVHSCGIPTKLALYVSWLWFYYNKSTKYACFHLQFLRGVLLGEKILGSLYVTDSTVLEFGFFTYSY